MKDESKKKLVIADEIKGAKMPKELDNIIYYSDERLNLLAYTVVLWGTVQHLFREKDSY